MRKNPYTGEMMQMEMINFPSGHISIEIFKKWITSNMPDFS